MGEVAHIKALTDVPEPVQPDVTLAPVHMGKFTFTPDGLKVAGKPTFEEWAEAMGVLAVLERGLAFVAGDLIVYGETAFGEAAAQIIDARSWRPETVRVYTWLARSVPQENRMLDRGLTVAHHLAVAALEPGQQRRWLKKALGEDDKPWPVSQLKAAIKNGAEEAETRWWVLVEARGARDQAELLKQLELDGRTCRAVTKRGA